MKYFLTAFVVICFTGCKAKAPAEISDPIQSETSHHVDEGDSPHTHETQNEGPIIAPETGVYKPYDRNDKSTWGTVVETMPDGTPSRYFKILPDGNSMTIVFHHALTTKGTSEKQPDTVAAPDGSIGSEYLHWNRPNLIDPIIVQDATSKPGWDRAVLKATRNWNRYTKYNIQYQKVGTRGVLGDNCGGFEDGLIRNDGVIRVCNHGTPAEDKRDEKSARMKGGEAHIYSSPKGHILSVMVELNHLHYQSLDENVDSDHAGQVRQYLACHEIGHALGLNHDMDHSFKVSCMGLAGLKRPKPNKKSKLKANLKPSPHDFEELERVSNHSHDEGQPLGVFCKEETEKWIRTYYLQRVTYNGVKAFAQREINVFKPNLKTTKKARVRFDTEDGQLIEIQWFPPNKHKMIKHTDGRGGEFPHTPKTEMTAKVTQSSKYKSVEEKLMTALRDGEVKNGPVGCQKLSEKEARDVSHFRPPKNGQGSGSYLTFQKEENLDGRRVDSPDVERIYKYVAYEGLSEIIADPVIEPYRAHSHEHR